MRTTLGNPPPAFVGWRGNGYGASPSQPHWRWTNLSRGRTSLGYIGAWLLLIVVLSTSGGIMGNANVPASARQ